MHESIIVTLRQKGMSADGSRFHLVNDLRKPDGLPVARITPQGAWFDLKQRKIAEPPPQLLALMAQLEKDEDFTEIPTNTPRRKVYAID